MARRIRTIKPEMLEDEKVATLPHDTWRLFVSVILLADDYGNLRASPKQIDGTVFWAFEDADVARMLRQLGERDLLRFYTVRGQRYAHITKWEKHQKVDHPGKPGCPGPAEAEPDGETGAEIRASDSRGVREEVENASRLTGTEIRTTIEDRERDPRAPVCDPSPQATEPEQPEQAPRPLVIAKPSTRPTAHQARLRWGQLRSEASEGRFLTWDSPGDPRGETAAWLAGLPDEAIPDLEPAMRLALSNIRDRVPGWDKADMWTDPNFGFSAFRARFTSLREHLHGRSAPQRAPSSGAARASPRAPVSPGHPDYVCSFHASAKNANRRAGKHEPACSECKHVAARDRSRTDSEPEPAFGASR